MTSLEVYVTRRIAHILAFIENETKFFEENAYFHQDELSYNRARAHELKMLCEYGIGDESLIEASKEMYRKIAALDELKQY